MYKGDIEIYQDAKTDLPSRFNLYERIKSKEEIGNEGSYLTEGEIQFQKFLEEPTVDNAVEFMVKFLGEIC